MQRSIADARRELEEAVLSPAERKRREREIKRHTDRLLVQVHERIANHYELLSGAIDDLDRNFAEVIEQLEELHQSLGRGQTRTASEAVQQYLDLTARRDALHRQAVSIITEVEQFEALEADPEAAVHEMLDRYPILQPQFSF